MLRSRLFGRPAELQLALLAHHRWIPGRFPDQRNLGTAGFWQAASQNRVDFIHDRLTERTRRRGHGHLNENVFRCGLNAIDQAQFDDAMRVKVGQARGRLGLPPGLLTIPQKELLMTDLFSPANKKWVESQAAVNMGIDPVNWGIRT